MQEKSKERIFSKFSMSLLVWGGIGIMRGRGGRKCSLFVLFNKVLFLLMWFVGYGSFMRDLKFFSARLTAEPKPASAILMILY